MNLTQIIEKVEKECGERFGGTIQYGYGGSEDKNVAKEIESFLSEKIKEAHKLGYTEAWEYFTNLRGTPKIAPSNTQENKKPCGCAKTNCHAGGGSFAGPNIPCGCKCHQQNQEIDKITPKNRHEDLWENQESEPYNETDHVHCWEEKSPPCGQKIKHYQCCLCEKVHPDIAKLSNPQESERCPLRVHPYSNSDEVPVCPEPTCLHILLPGEKICPCHQQNQGKIKRCTSPTFNKDNWSVPSENQEKEDERLEQNGLARNPSPDLIFTKPENQESDWEKEFDRQFLDYIVNDESLPNIGIKDFIRHLLSNQKSSLVEKIEGMFGVDAAWVEDGLPKREIYLVKKDVLALLKRD